MRNLIYFFLFILCSCASKTTTNTRHSNTIKFKELKFGICTTEAITEQRMSSSPSGHQLIADEFKLIKSTDHILAELQQEFGIEYILKSNFNGFASVDQVWIFPEAIRDDEGKLFKEVRYSTEKPVNTKTFSIYAIEKPYEIVKGEWIYQMWYEGQKIYERKFYIE
jgi:hypothetical protein